MLKDRRSSSPRSLGSRPEKESPATFCVRIYFSQHYRWKSGRVTAVGTFPQPHHAAGDRTLISDIGDDENAAVFSTANVANLSTVTRLDGVGFGANVNAGSALREPGGKGMRVGVLSAAGPNGVCDLLREGNNLPAVSGSTTEHSFFRKECDYVGGVGCAANGDPKDSNDNHADFMFADTQGTFITGVVQSLGAPGPENLFSPIRRDTSGIGAPLLDGPAASSSPPNRARSFTSNPAQNSTFGTLIIRRRVLNSTGGSVTRLRSRIIDLTAFPSAGGGQADLRAISSVGASVRPVGDAAICAASGAGPPPCTVTVTARLCKSPRRKATAAGATRRSRPGRLTTGTPLAHGASLNVQFVLGIEATGTFRFYIVIEALP